MSGALTPQGEWLGRTPDAQGAVLHGTVSGVKTWQAIATVAIVALVIGLGFLGTRAIWDPDEGRYTNVALNMLDSGDWVHPRRTDDVGHWTKPPVTYWSIAASTGLFGRNPWAARLPVALAYLACVFLTWRIARRVAPGTEKIAALVFATMFVPAFSSQIITTDFVLAALQTLAMAAYVEARFGRPERMYVWASVMWLGFALAFLTKGPPALLPLLAVVVFAWLVPAKRPGRLMLVIQALLFLVVAAPWYAIVIVGEPALLEYFVGAEVVGRFASDQFDRHGQWYGWLKIYAPTLILGTLPWTGHLFRWVRSLPSQARGWRSKTTRAQDAPALFLALWVLLPLLVFCLARSRMPLYLLPLFVPLAILIATQWVYVGNRWPRLRSIALIVAFYVVIRLGTAAWPTHKNASEWAEAIRERAVRPVTEVLFIEDMARYGINLHLKAQVEKISIEPREQSTINPGFDEDLECELAERDPGSLYIIKQERWAEIQARAATLGFRAVALGTPFRGRVMFDVEQTSAVLRPRLPMPGHHASFAGN